MPSFWRKAAIFAGVIGAVWTASCTGQQLEGRWRGPFPLAGGKECVLNLYSSGSFDLACGQGDWIGAGKYRQDGDKLRLDFAVLHRNRKPVPRLPVLSLPFEAHGNEIVLRNDAGQRFGLERRLP